ncbi:hypothetical protein ACVO8F_000361 [Vibrio cholerae]|nr:hypothetical protein [Vibrio cholerae]
MHQQNNPLRNFEETNMEKEKEACRECGGTGVGKVIGRTQQAWEEEGCPYAPIECQHCHGSGVEPS